MGEGVTPVPAKLVAKNRNGEFVDMGKLLPEFWSGPKDDYSKGRKEVKAGWGRKVTDIFTWIQFFGSYVAYKYQTWWIYSQSQKLSRCMKVRLSCLCCMMQRGVHVLCKHYSFTKWLFCNTCTDCQLCYIYGQIR